MTDKWFIDEIQDLLQVRNRVVMYDPQGLCGFLLPLLAQNQITVLKTDPALKADWQTQREELFLRHEAETIYAHSPVVFYVTRPQEKLTFLYDYCFTHGCLNLKNPIEWLSQKLFRATGLQVNLPDSELMAAAKSSFGKELNWWKTILHGLGDVVQLDKELLPFLHDPTGYFADKDADSRQLFEEKVAILLGEPHSTQPAETLAKACVHRLFEGLLKNNVSETWLKIYYQWTDSAHYSPSLKNYLHSYELPAWADAFQAHRDHCFEALDRAALRQIAESAWDADSVFQKLQTLKPRIFQSKVKPFVPAWWTDVWALFDPQNAHLPKIKGLPDLIVYYTETFSKIDRAIRHLYQSFLNDETLIRPFQERYESLNANVLQTWFDLYRQYQSNQQGFLPQLFSQAAPKTAVIVGDGVRYEMADYVASELAKHFQVEKETMLADLPSETEHNMSALYVGGGEVLPIQKDRETRLKQSTGKDLVYLSLEQLNPAIEADYLVLTYKDIDSAGEKLQQGSLKLFSEFESVLIDKITELLKMGYQSVHLVTDHGFVLTGLLEDSDKIDPNAVGKKDVHERFIRTVEKQHAPDWLGFEKPYQEFQYLYVAKNCRPFKSKGVYGFSHGGFTPQEMIIPNFKFANKKSQTAKLKVLISNKLELTEVTGELFVLKIEATNTGSDLFAAQRKIHLQLFAENKRYFTTSEQTILAGKLEKFEFHFQGNPKVIAILTDAETQEQLDKVTVQKSNARDLGGLI